MLGILLAHMGEASGPGMMGQYGSGYGPGTGGWGMMGSGR